MQPVIIVHGGAGTWNLKTDRLDLALKACERAAQAGQTVLLNGGSALDAVETAVRILEDDPSMDAGRGSYLNTDGEVELDALIMDGRHLDLGVVAAVRGIANPISLARRVMSETPHCILVAHGAEAFANHIGFPRCNPADLIIPEEAALHQAHLAPEVQGAMGDTVGAVAYDTYGNIAVGTSTGGTRQKMVGRVGDSPLVGSGGYADNRTAGVSATGHGEDLMKVVISKQVCDFVALGLNAQSACETAVQLLEERVQGLGGVIAIDARGHVGMAYNTDAMPHAYAIGEADVVVGQ